MRIRRLRREASQPLTPYTFTMNWQFTRAAQRVYFEEGEPFCHVFRWRDGNSKTSIRGWLGSRRTLSSRPNTRHGRPAASSSTLRCPIRIPRRRGRSGKRPIFEGSIPPAMMRPTTIEASFGWRRSGQNDRHGGTGGSGRSIIWRNSPIFQLAKK